MALLEEDMIKLCAIHMYLYVILMFVTSNFEVPAFQNYKHSAKICIFRKLFEYELEKRDLRILVIVTLLITCHYDLEVRNGSVGHFIKS